MKQSNLFSQRVFFQEPTLNILKKDYMLIDMHTHTKYSHDSRTPISDLLGRASSLGIGFAVTDHLQAKGAIEASKQKKVRVIPGIEILSIEGKEIILYFYDKAGLVSFYQKNIEKYKKITKEPKSIFGKSLVSVKCTRTMQEIIDSANQHNCLKSIPHPYTYFTRSSHKFFTRNKSMMKKIDAVEIINSTLQPRRNKKAAIWAIGQNKAFTAGSDAHMATQLGRAVVAAKADSTEEFLDSVRKKDALILGGEMNRREALKNILDMNYIKRHKKWDF